MLIYLPRYTCICSALKSQTPSIKPYMYMYLYEVHVHLLVKMSLWYLTGKSIVSRVLLRVVKMTVNTSQKCPFVGQLVQQSKTVR